MICDINYTALPFRLSAFNLGIEMQEKTPIAVFFLCVLIIVLRCDLVLLLVDNRCLSLVK